MGVRILSKFAALAVLGMLALSSARAEDRPADKILADINGVAMPPIPEDRNDQKAIREYIQARQKAMEAKADLIAELYKAHPGQAELLALMPERWMIKARMLGQIAPVKAEVEDLIATSKNEKLVGEASYFQSSLAIQTAARTAKIDDLLPAVEAFAAKYPKDERVASLLLMVASRGAGTDAQEALFKRIEKDYPKSVAATQQVPTARAWAEGERRQLSSIGKPFELEFTEASKGTQVTMAGLKGKVVVIDFWATWCGPCIAEMPTMKKLYAEYKDKGVEFIGVSLDQPKEQGGDEKLKKYVAENGIEWPQYYQGNFWQSEFSMSWGVNAIPCVFLVDGDGNLASVQARGKLETMIPEYLEKAKAKKTASNP